MSDEIVVFDRYITGMAGAVVVLAMLAAIMGRRGHDPNERNRPLRGVFFGAIVLAIVVFAAPAIDQGASPPPKIRRGKAGPAEHPGPDARYHAGRRPFRAESAGDADPRHEPHGRPRPSVPQGHRARLLDRPFPCLAVHRPHSDSARNDLRPPSVRSGGAGPGRNPGRAGIPHGGLLGEPQYRRQQRFRPRIPKLRRALSLWTRGPLPGLGRKSIGPFRRI